jgi:membrane-associated HD superfamily phosphohydrolase
MSGSPLVARIAGAVLVAVLAVAAALVFLLVYLVVTPPVYALIVMGVVALVFAAITYIARSFTRDPGVARAASWGFIALGSALLVLTFAFPDSTLSTVQRTQGEILSLIVVAIVAVGVWWLTRANVAVEQREVARRDWDSRPPVNALSYTTAQPPPATSSSPPSVPGGKP